jgi:ribonuclease BN (tRNA processing enzyme)
MSELVFIGTSDAFGAGGRRQSAILLRAPGGGVLLDCGATTLTGLVELGIERSEIASVVISHFHGDHFAGIPALLLAALYEDERKEALRIAGPPGVEARVRALSDAMGYGLHEREWSFPLLFDELSPRREVEVGPVRVAAFEVLHQPHTSPHGLIVNTGCERVAYSGDTGWFDELPRRVHGVDLFVCECTYHGEGFGLHLSHTQLCLHRDEFECGRMLLTHLGRDMVERRDERDFDTADDGLVVEL